MRRLGCVPAALVLCLALCACSYGPERTVERALGLNLPRAAGVSSSDTHGGFHGDGLLLIALTFAPEDGAAVEELLQDRGDAWNPGPFDAYLGGVLYGGGPAGEGGWPRSPKNGYWYFQDRQTDRARPLDKRPSFNYTAALYDGDTCTLYYLELDT